MNSWAAAAVNPRIHQRLTMSKRMRSGPEERSAKMRRTALGKEKLALGVSSAARAEGGVRPTPTEAGFYAESRAPAAAVKRATSQPHGPFASDAVVHGTAGSAGAGSMVRSAASAAESASAGTLSTLLSHVRSKTASTS